MALIRSYILSMVGKFKDGTSPRDLAKTVLQANSRALPSKRGQEINWLLLYRISCKMEKVLHFIGMGCI